MQRTSERCRRPRQQLKLVEIIDPQSDGALDLLRKTLEALRAERGEDYSDPQLTHEKSDETPEPWFQRAEAAWVSVPSTTCVLEAQSAWAAKR